VILQHGLTQSVAVTSGAGRVISRAVAFDAEKVAAALGRIEDTEIDEKSSDTDLRMHLVTEAIDSAPHGFLERRVLFTSCALGDGEPSGFGELQEGFEAVYSSSSPTGEVDVICPER
jgi:hypothetical protein